MCLTFLLLFSFLGKDPILAYQLVNAAASSEAAELSFILAWVYSWKRSLLQEQGQGCSYGIRNPWSGSLKSSLVMLAQHPGAEMSFLTPIPNPSIVER